ncbi:hypothetical protein [Streptomyces sp. NPDC051909]
MPRVPVVLLGQGLTNQRISKRLGLGAGTVKSYISGLEVLAHSIKVLAA